MTTQPLTGDWNSGVVSYVEACINDRGKRRVAAETETFSINAKIPFHEKRAGAAVFKVQNARAKVLRDAQAYDELVREGH